MLTTFTNLKSRFFIAAVAFVLLSAPLSAGDPKPYISGQDDAVSVDFPEASLGTVIRELQRQTSYKFVYSNTLVDDEVMVSVSVENEPLSLVLHMVLEPLGLEYDLMDKQVVIYPRQDRPSRETISVRGTVTGSDGLGLPGVLVKEKDSERHTVSDQYGNYEIKGVDIGGTLVFDCLGMLPSEEKVQARNIINVRMSEESTYLDAVVVTGYQTLSRERSAGSYGVVSSKDLDERLDVSVVDRLKGKVAGMTSYRGTMQIRGQSTINGTRTPLYVVDGVPYEGDLDAINPAEIVNVTVLKDATAASIYGARSANGVIVISTRSGEAGPTRVKYNGIVKLTPLVDEREYANLMTSSEFVDYQVELFNRDAGTYQPQYAMNEVRTLLFQHKEGKITGEQLEQGLDYYRGLDNTEQIRKTFLRNVQVQHQHNLALSGGAEKYNYALSVNYNQSLLYEKARQTDNWGFRLRNTFKFFDWFRADVNLLGSLSDNEYFSGFSGYSIWQGNGGIPSYRMLYDGNGELVRWYQQKSQQEIDRLTGLGLFDESYFPTEELERTVSQQKNSYFNLNINLNFRIVQGLTLDIRYATDMANIYSKTLYDKNSYLVRNMVNDATQIVDGEIVRNIPEGGQVRESRSDKDSYTLRAQVNYDKLFGEKHRLTAIAGGEIRAVKSSGTSTYNVGYDDNSLVYKTINEKDLTFLMNTESLTGYFIYGNESVTYAATENRYVSFYANASYTYNDRLSVTASIRMDQSNLFGTDPKYQYRPLWSAGLQYIIFDRDKVSWIDNLSVRATYGINGNVAKQSGPYLTVSDAGINDWINDYQSTITYPPNSGLRWEKTAVTNVAVDFSLFKGRLTGTVEFYDKSTSDLLYKRTSDPTYGWSNMTVNYGDMFNRGVELSLSTVNCRTKDFIWTSDFNFSYNKNELTRIENTNGAPINYLSELQTRVGLPLSSIFSVRWAGLDSEGNPQAYKKDGTIVKSLADLEVDDLVYSGTAVPKYAAAFSNTLRWKELSLSFMFTYYGGHCMRGVFGEYIVGTAPSINPDRLNANFWRKPGDEADPDVSPAPMTGVNANKQNLWKAADKHMQKGDYIKLENIVLSYYLPQRLLRDTFIRGVRVSFQADNVCFCWEANRQGLNPETWTGTGLASDRGTLTPAVYSLGVALEF